MGSWELCAYRPAFSSDTPFPVCNHKHCCVLLQAGKLGEKGLLKDLNDNWGRINSIGGYVVDFLSSIVVHGLWIFLLPAFLLLFPILAPCTFPVNFTVCGIPGSGVVSRIGLKTFEILTNYITGNEVSKRTSAPPFIAWLAQKGSWWTYMVNFTTLF